MTQAMTEEEFLSRLLYRDALMLVIDKPAGLPVHPGPKGGTTLADYLDLLRFGLPRQPEIAHRLDKDTSGCLVLGRHAKALTRLGNLFKTNRIDKTYLAVVEGGPESDDGVITLPLSPRSKTRGWWMKVDPEGQPAETRWRVLGRTKSHTTLELKPITGRTHQLRIHCSASGWPILGDTIYGAAPRDGGPRLHLHAAEIVIPLYPKKDPVIVRAPVPEDMTALVCRGSAPNPAGGRFPPDPPQ